MIFITRYLFGYPPSDMVEFTAAAEPTLKLEATIEINAPAPAFQSVFKHVLPRSPKEGALQSLSADKITVQ
jgi:hypothetical protein